MGFFKSLTKLAINTVTLPVAATVDLVTINGNNTRKTVERMDRNLEKMKKSVDD